MRGASLPAIEATSSDDVAAAVRSPGGASTPMYAWPLDTASAVGRPAAAPVPAIARSIWAALVVSSPSSPLQAST